MQTWTKSWRLIHWDYCYWHRSSVFCYERSRRRCSLRSLHRASRGVALLCAGSWTLVGSDLSPEEWPDSVLAVACWVSPMAVERNCLTSAVRLRCSPVSGSEMPVSQVLAVELCFPTAIGRRQGWVAAVTVLGKPCRCDQECRQVACPCRAGDCCWSLPRWADGCGNEAVRRRQAAPS